MTVKCGPGDWTRGHCRVQSCPGVCYQTTNHLVETSTLMDLPYGQLLWCARSKSDITDVLKPEPSARPQLGGRGQWDTPQALSCLSVLCLM